MPISHCEICHEDGLYFVAHADPDGYVVLACMCPLGQRWRVKWQLRAFASRLVPAPIWCGRLEEFFSATEIASLRAHPRTHTVQGGREQVPA